MLAVNIACEIVKWFSNCLAINTFTGIKKIIKVYNQFK